jgi:hypothetical protein
MLKPEPKRSCAVRHQNEKHHLKLVLHIIDRQCRIFIREDILHIRLFSFAGVAVTGPWGFRKVLTFSSQNPAIP